LLEITLTTSIVLLPAVRSTTYSISCPTVTSVINQKGMMRAIVKQTPVMGLAAVASAVKSFIVCNRPFSVAVGGRWSVCH